MAIWISLMAVAIALMTVFIAMAASKPNEFLVVREGEMPAGAGEVFDRIDDLHAWKDWSPWAKIDPAMVETHSGSPRGVGAVYHWKGNRKVGEGRMTITESVPVEKVAFDLEFLAPFKARNKAIFIITPLAEGRSRVRWEMHGKNSGMLKVMGLFCNMDAMIGKDFEKGLRQLAETVRAEG